MKILKNISLTLFVSSILLSCSSGDKLAREENQVAALESGMYLSEPDEDGVVELIIPEVEEYTKVKDEAEEIANSGALELGTSQEAEDEAESVQRSIASIGTEETEDVISQEEDFDEVTELEVAEEKPDYTMDSENIGVREDMSGEKFHEYQVQKNDSLMLISFKLYNNFDNWKEIAEWNGINKNSNYFIREGDRIKFKLSTAEGTNWVPSGNPYLVKVGDILGKISKKVYEGNARFWYDIWKNNDTLIKDPNRVFVGFTLFTPPMEVVLENERVRMDEYKRRHGKSIRKRDLAGALENDNKI
jgi:nucleoid-associated protein YgaU